MPACSRWPSVCTPVSALHGGRVRQQEVADAGAHQRVAGICAAANQPIAAGGHTCAGKPLEGSTASLILLRHSQLIAVHAGVNASFPTATGAE